MRLARVRSTVLRPARTAGADHEAKERHERILERVKRRLRFNPHARLEERQARRVRLQPSIELEVLEHACAHARTIRGGCAAQSLRRCMSLALPKAPGKRQDGGRQRGAQGCGEAAEGGGPRHAFSLVQNWLGASVLLPNMLRSCQPQTGAVDRWARLQRRHTERGGHQRRLRHTRHLSLWRRAVPACRRLGLVPTNGKEA